MNNRLERLIGEGLVDFKVNPVTKVKYYFLTAKGEEKLSQTVAIDAHSGSMSFSFIFRDNVKEGSNVSVYSVAATKCTFDPCGYPETSTGCRSINFDSLKGNNQVSIIAKTDGKFARFEAKGGIFSSPHQIHKK